MALTTSAPQRAQGDSTSDRRDGLAYRPAAGRTPHNVGDPERVASVALGAALIVYGFRRRDRMGLAAALAGGAFMRRGAAGHCPVYNALGVSTGDADAVLTRDRSDLTGRAATVNARKAIKIEHSVIVLRPRAELYAFWRDFTNLPQFMEHLVAVRVDSPARSHWTVKVPGGKTVEWEAEIVNDVPDEIVAWKSVGDPDVANAGAVNFSDAPGDRGTVVKVTLDYEPPGGKFGAVLARLFGEDPDRQVREDLRRFKQLMETGEITTSARRRDESASVGSTPQE
jgi:uncharacterized membrane protein